MTNSEVARSTCAAQEGAAARPPRKKKRSLLERRENRVAFAFILPALLSFTVFTVVPLVFTVILSLGDYNVIRQTYTFTGFENFADLFDPGSLYFNAFMTSIANTCVLIIEVPLAMMLGMLTACWLASDLIHVRVSKTIRMFLYLPAVCSAVASNIIWRYLFTNDAYEQMKGIINAWLGLDIWWLRDRGPLLAAIIIKNTLMGSGSAMILYYASLINISSDYYEAADLDGANAWHKFCHITFPMLTPVTFYLLIMRLSGCLQSYADSAIFANKSPNAQTIVYFIWDYGINQYNYSIASAASLVLAIVIMALTVLQFRFSNRWVVKL